MNWLSMPSLSALRAFSAFSEARNLARAGDMLNVSHAAISQQIRALEAHMGVSLVERSGKGLQLTEDGETLARALALGFGAIGNAVSEITRKTNQAAVSVSCTAMFATHWLMPRLPEFRARHPDVDLVINATADIVPLGPGHADLAIRYGEGTWEGVESSLILPSPYVLVAAPELVAKHGIDGLSGIEELTFLEELGTTEVSDWFEREGLGPQQATRSAGRVELPGHLLFDAVLAGQGVAVKVERFARPYLEAGRMLELARTRLDGGYHVVHLPGGLRPGARAFVRWLKTHSEA